MQYSLVAIGTFLFNSYKYQEVLSKNN